MFLRLLFVVPIKAERFTIHAVENFYLEILLEFKMGHGGSREGGGGRQPGAGRPKGSLSALSSKAKLAAAATGILPHEWLLKVSRGEPITQKRWDIKYDEKGKELSRTLVEEEIYPDFPARTDAAKAAAPYYAPKLATQTVTLKGDASAPLELAKNFKVLSDKELETMHNLTLKVSDAS